MMRSRRGISSVVGAVFAIIALSTVIGYITYSMNVLTNYNQSVLIRTQQMTDVANEKFQVSSVSYVNNKFSIIVNNTGSLPINFTKIWITNKTTSACNTYSCNINYVPNKVVVPGNGTTLGQKMSGTIDTTKPYNVKIVTSRGNSQQFTVNSVSSAPLNILLLAIPPSVAGGFTTQLIMTVTNNGSSLLTNLVPTYTLLSGADCTIGPVSPASYNTLAPGNTAIFSWTVTLSKTGISGDTCKYQAQLQGGYSNNYAQTTITLNDVSFTSTTLAANTGVLTINYTTWLYTQGSGWKATWSMPHGVATGIAVNLTNNNPTKTFYISNKTALATQLSNSNCASCKSTAYIVSNVTSTGTLTKFTCSGYPTNDYCVAVSPGQTVTLSIGGDNIGSSASSTLQSTGGQSGPSTAFLLLYGKFDTSRSGNGAFYAQDIPFIAIYLT